MQDDPIGRTQNRTGGPVTSEATEAVLQVNISTEDDGQEDQNVLVGTRGGGPKGRRDELSYSFEEH